MDIETTPGEADLKIKSLKNKQRPHWPHITGKRFHRCGKHVTKIKKTMNEKVTTGYVNEPDQGLLYNEYVYQIVHLKYK